MSIKHSLNRLIILTLSLAIVPACSAKNYQGKINDAEVHLVDYFQNSAGTQALIANMDKLNIEHSIVMGLPVIKSGLAPSLCHRALFMGMIRRFITIHTLTS